MTLFELTDAINLINDAVLDDAKVIIGTSIDDNSQGEISITVIATGFELKPQTATITSARDVAPSIDNIFGTSTFPPAVGAATPALPPLQQSFTNIEIPDFLKK